MKPSRKLTLFICICAIMITGCKSARYGKRYEANLKEFSRLTGPVKTPKQMGDSIEEKIKYSIEKNKEIISDNTISNIAGIFVGTGTAIITPLLPIGKENKNLISDIAIAGIVISVIDMATSISEPIAYNKMAVGIIYAWDNSKQDNVALTSLRAALYSLQETWPVYAP